jgi:putative FmdB family regulatory protein
VPIEESEVPTYQYACTGCGHQLEAVQSFSDDPLTTCPQCQGRLRKLFSSVGIVFKGSGFYRTDSRANGGGKSASTGTSTSGPSGTSGEGGGTKKANGGSGDAASRTGEAGKSTAPSTSAKAGSSGSSGSSGTAA